MAFGILATDLSSACAAPSYRQTTPPQAEDPTTPATTRLYVRVVDEMGKAVSGVPVHVDGHPSLQGLVSNEDGFAIPAGAAVAVPGAPPQALVVPYLGPVTTVFAPETDGHSSSKRDIVWSETDGVALVRLVVRSWDSSAPWHTESDRPFSWTWTGMNDGILVPLPFQVSMHVPAGSFSEPFQVQIAVRASHELLYDVAPWGAIAMATVGQIHLRAIGADGAPLDSGHFAQPVRLELTPMIHSQQSLNTSTPLLVRRLSDETHGWDIVGAGAGTAAGSASVRLESFSSYDILEDLRSLKHLILDPMDYVYRTGMQLPPLNPTPDEDEDEGPPPELEHDESTACETKASGQVFCGKANFTLAISKETMNSIGGYGEFTYALETQATVGAANLTKLLAKAEGTIGHNISAKAGGGFEISGGYQEEWRFERDGFFVCSEGKVQVDIVYSVHEFELPMPPPLEPIELPEIRVPKWPQVVVDLRGQKFCGEICEGIGDWMFVDKGACDTQ